MSTSNYPADVSQAINQVDRRHLWESWRENLEDWQEWRGEHQNLVTLNVQAGIYHLHHKPLAQRREEEQKKKERAARYQFLETESFVAQFFLFIGSSVSLAINLLKEKLNLRHKNRAYSHGVRRSWFEQIKLHPALFLGTAAFAAAVCALFSLYTMASQVTYDGVVLGNVNNARTISAAVENLEEITRATLGQEDYTVDMSLIEKDGKWISRRDLETQEELEDQLSQQLGEVAYAYVLYINGEPIAATTFPGALEELLEQLKVSYRTENTVDCYFEEEVEVREEYIDTEYVKNLGYIAETMNETKSGEVIYTVKSGDVPGTIAEDAGITLEQLKSMNRGYNWDILHVGDELTVATAVPYLTVVNVERQNYVQDVPYTVNYEDDTSMYQGDYKVLSPGVFGKADVAVNVTYVNGEETGRQTVASTTLVEPIEELQARGTIPRPSWFPTGTFRWPCNGIITSRFGHRNTGIPGATTNHQGIDIANSSGTPIYAADGGTVKTAGWGGSSWGYLVVIDHGNGYMTYYGHNSRVIVSAGDHVYKGQQISLMGSTGVSSGPHCHFGVKLNGTFVDPLNYLA